MPEAWSSPVPGIGTATWVVWTDGVNTMARNTVTNQFINGTDAATVIQSAINALPSGGEIFVKEGIYLLSARIEIKSKIHFVGAELNATILRANAAGIDLLYFGSNSQEVTVENLYLDGNKAAVASGNGITIVPNSWDIHIRNIRIVNTHGVGISMVGTAANPLYGTFENIFIVDSDSRAMQIGPYVMDSWWSYVNSIRNRYISVRGPGTTGLWFDQLVCDTHNVGLEGYGMILGDTEAVNDVLVTRSQFYNCNLEGLVVQIPTANNSNRIRIFDCLFASNGRVLAGTRQNLWFVVTGSGNFVECNVRGNTFYGGGIPQYGIAFSNAANYVRCLCNGNTFDTTHTIAPILLPSSGVKVKDNPGFITENTGTATGTGAQQTIAHGCAFTPTYDQVFLTERSTGGALAYQSAAPDATNIYITAALNKTYNWRVSRDP